MADLRALANGALLFAMLAFLAGCGKKGPLIPPEALVPAQIVNLAVVQRGERFEVSWSAPNRQQGGSTLGDLAGFELFRHTVLPPAEDCEECPTAYSKLARIDLDYLQGVRRVGDRYLYDDRDLVPGSSYRYKVRSFTTEGTQSRDSNKPQHRVITPPAAPVVEALPSTYGVVLAFVAPPPKEGKPVGFNIYRSTKGEDGQPRPLNVAPVTGSTFDDQTHLLGMSYIYTVTSVVALNGETVESVPSNGVEGALADRD